jgi:hypothetical protein
MSMRVRRAAVSVAVAVAAASAVAAPAAASAASIALDKPCYDEQTPATITGAGFTPGDTIDLETTNSNLFTTAPVDATGAFSTQTPAPLLGTIDPAQQSFTLNAISEMTGAVLASTTIQVATFAALTKPSEARPSAKVRFTFSGFTPGRTIYGHYLRHGKVTATTRFGPAAFPCGTLTTKARMYPSEHPATGVYKIQFDSNRRFIKNTPQKLTGSLTIFTRFF